VVLRAMTMIRKILFYLLIDMSLRRSVLVYGGGLAYLQFGFAGAALSSFLALKLGENPGREDESFNGRSFSTCIGQKCLELYCNR
jgi:hypothetical protein